MSHGYRRAWVSFSRNLFVAALALSGSTSSQTDEETRLGECGVPVPMALTCRDLPEWSDFLARLRANAEKGWPADRGLLDAADAIVERRAAAASDEHPPEGFYNYLCGDAPWPLPDRFCLLGFVGALFVRARHFIMAGDRESIKQADMELKYIDPILGKELNLDFLDSSPWPVSILDVFININETEFITYSDYARRNPVRAPAVAIESLSWKAPSPEYTQRLYQRSLRSEVAVSVFGTHATLSLEPITMIEQVTQSVDIQIKTTFFGIEPRWCKILGLCNLGAPELTRLLRSAEEDPFSYPWSSMTKQISEVYATDASLQAVDLLVCTEPVSACLMLLQVLASKGRPVPMLGYFGVALLNGCPPQDVPMFWRAFGELLKSADAAVLAVNNRILSEQIFYQTGKRLPYVRAHGLYTGASYTPLLRDRILLWRSPLYVYSTLACAVARFLEGMPQYPIHYQFVEESQSIPYNEAASHLAITMLPHDHALMSFYEIYSMGVPLLLPGAEWMYRLLYMRGQLSVGERWYQSIMPGHNPPPCEFADAEEFKERAGAPDPSWGVAAASQARGAAEQVLERALKATDLASAKKWAQAAQDLLTDMKFFLVVAGNSTHLDSETSMGAVRRSVPIQEYEESLPPAPQPAVDATGPWHPYTPFQMSTRDSNDWTRMRKGGWWLRRGVRFDAMRYWYQFSDFARFPGLTYFNNVPELLCQAQTLDISEITVAMRKYNEATLGHSGAFWSYAVAQLVGQD